MITEMKLKKEFGLEKTLIFYKIGLPIFFFRKNHFFLIDNYNFKTVYTNGTKMRKVNEKNCEKYLYSFL